MTKDIKETVVESGTDTVETTSGTSELEQLKAENAALKAENSELKADRVSLHNDLEEARKSKIRLENQVGKKIDRAIGKVALEIIDIADVLEQAASSITQADRDADPKLNDLARGIELTRVQLDDAFNKVSVKTQDNLIGQKFDSRFHEAVDMVPAVKGEESGTIVKVNQTGYVTGEGEKQKAIRAAKVTIAQ